MTRRRVVFIDRNGVRCITGEFNGDKSEFAKFLPGSADGCNKDWSEIEKLFKNCKTYIDFVKANVEAQSAYHSAFAEGDIPTVHRMQWNETMPKADDIFYVVHPERQERAKEELANLVEKQNDYLRRCGGPFALLEADDAYNDLNREIIAAYQMLHGNVYLGSVNFYDEKRKDVVRGVESIYEKYTGQIVYNFGCSFCVPNPDEKLEKMIRKWNSGLQAGEIKAITKRIEELGGINFIWY